MYVEKTEWGKRPSAPVGKDNLARGVGGLGINSPQLSRCLLHTNVGAPHPPPPPHPPHYHQPPPTSPRGTHLVHKLRAVCGVARVHACPRQHQRLEHVKRQPRAGAMQQQPLGRQARRLPQQHAEQAHVGLVKDQLQQVLPL